MKRRDSNTSDLCCCFRRQPARWRHGRWQQELPLWVRPSGPYARVKGHHQSYLVWVCPSGASQLHLPTIHRFLHSLFALCTGSWFYSLYFILLCFIYAHARVNVHQQLLGKSSQTHVTQRHYFTLLSFLPSASSALFLLVLFLFSYGIFWVSDLIWSPL